MTELTAGELVAYEAGVKAEDEAIERAAIALCWYARPVVLHGPPDAYRYPEVWWNQQTEIEQRLHRGRARIAIEAWEETDQIGSKP